jgi:hypothetical protein
MASEQLVWVERLAALEGQQVFVEDFGEASLLA